MSCFRTQLLRGVLGVAVAFAAVSVGPVQALGNHVTCGQQITEDTRLDADLTCFSTAEPALTLAAKGVKLDLGGHRIFSPQNVGVLNDGHHGVTIKNGGVISPQPIVIHHANRSRITRMQAGGGGDTGIVLSDSDRNRVSRSSAETDSGGVALYNGSDRNVIERNELGAGVGVPMVIFDSDRNVVRRNDVTQGDRGGLVIGGGSDNTTVKRNELCCGGFSIFSSGGIAVLAETTNTLIERNHVHAYRVGSGIRVDSPSTTLTRNSSNDNGDWGILAVPGVTDGGGNTASGNGVGQCLNVSC